MKHKETGITKSGYYGFSWTTFFFGFFPALFRGDFITFIGGFVISIIIGILTWGIGYLFIGLIWAFMYNKYRAGLENLDSCISDKAALN